MSRKFSEIFFSLGILGLLYILLNVELKGFKGTLVIAFVVNWNAKSILGSDRKWSVQQLRPISASTVLWHSRGTAVVCLF